MFFVVGNHVYASTKNKSGKYPLVSISIDSAGVVSLTDKGEGITTLPPIYKKMTLEEVIATFGTVGTVTVEAVSSNAGATTKSKAKTKGAAPAE